jgi:hypothetical protein
MAMTTDPQGPPRHPGRDHERQFQQAVQGVFGTELGRWLLKELQATTQKVFDSDNQYKTAYNCGAQDLVALLVAITEGK